jgi:hypothetical protein
MTLTTKQCRLLLDMFNASLKNAINSGIPIGNEYYEDIDTIKEKLRIEMQEAISRENGGAHYGSNN